MKIFYFLPIILMCYITAFSQAGLLDNTYGVGGLVSTNTSEDSPVMAVQSDGKVIMAGSVITPPSGSNFDFIMARFNTDGSIDNTFGNNGRVITDLGTNFDFLYCISIKADGKIVVAGSSGNGFRNLVIARYSQSGVLDATFGTNGLVTSSIIGHPTSMLLYSDGKVLVGGYTNGTGYDVFVTRYDALGILDNSFNGTGQIIQILGTDEDICFSLALQPDNKILVGGYTKSVSPTPHCLLIRYNSNGTLDNTFANNGISVLDLGSNEGIYSLALQNDGTIVAGGNHINSSGYGDFLLMRYTVSGILDNSFGNSGSTYTNFGANATCYSLQLQNDGKIVCGGSTQNLSGNSDFAMARFSNAGFLDNTFNGSGKVTTGFSPGSNDGAFSLKLFNNYIYLGGKGGNGFGIARYLNDASVLAFENVSFSGRSLDKKVFLAWDYFFNDSIKNISIERSTNSINFSTIAIFQNENLIKKNYTDNPLLSSRFFYRLKFTLLNGRISYSKIISVPLVNNTNLEYYPNPVINNLNVHIKYSEKIKSEIYNIGGQLLKEPICTEGIPGWININVGDIDKGVYLLKIKEGMNINSLKFIKL